MLSCVRFGSYYVLRTESRIEVFEIDLHDSMWVMSKKRFGPLRDRINTNGRFDSLINVDLDKKLLFKLVMGLPSCKF